MPIEAGTYVSDLDASNPAGTDDRSQGDNHLRLIKLLLKTTFPNASKAFRFPNSGATKTGSFSVVFPDDQNKLYVIDSTGGSVVVSLPDPTTGGTPNEDGFGFWLLRSAGANSVTVNASGGQTIMGASSYTMAANRQYAYFFWAGTINQWFIFEGNNPALTYGLQIVTAAETALVVRRTENNTSELTLASWRVGSGAGDVAADTVVGTGANAVAERRRYIGATELERITKTLYRIFLNLQVGNNLLFNSAGFCDLTEIAAPASPAANVGRVYTQSLDGVTTLAYKRSDGSVVLLKPAVQLNMEVATDVDRFVSPGRQHFHPGHPKAGGTFDGSGTLAITAGDYGLGAITDNGQGIYTLGLDTAFSNTNYWCTSWARGSNRLFGLHGTTGDTKTSSSFQVRSSQADGGASPIDTTEGSIMFWGDYA